MRGRGKRVRKSLPMQCIPSCFGEFRRYYFNPGSMVSKENLAWKLVGIPTQAVLWFPQISPHERHLPSQEMDRWWWAWGPELWVLKKVTNGDGASWSGPVSSPGMCQGQGLREGSGTLGFSWH